MLLVHVCDHLENQVAVRPKQVLRPFDQTVSGIEAVKCLYSFNLKKSIWLVTQVLLAFLGKCIDL